MERIGQIVGGQLASWVHGDSQAYAAAKDHVFDHDLPWLISMLMPTYPQHHQRPYEAWGLGCILWCPGAMLM